MSFMLHYDGDGCVEVDMQSEHAIALASPKRRTGVGRRLSPARLLHRDPRDVAVADLADAAEALVRPSIFETRRVDGDGEELIGWYASEGGAKSRLDALRAALAAWKDANK